MPRVRQSPRNSLNDRPAPWRLTLRRLRKWVRPALLTVIGVVAFATVATLIRAAQPGAMANQTLASLRERLGGVTAASGLRVADVVIEGRQNTPEPLLRAAIGVSKGDPIMGFSVEQARARIETLSWVEHATVERRLPSTVVVYVEERRPFAIWQNRGKFQLVDRTGQVVNQDISQFRKLPQIVGEGAPAAAAALLERPLAAIDMRLPDRLVLRPRPDLAKETAPTPVVAKKPT